MKALLEEYFDRLWPICRSISGDGLRESLKIISELIPLELHEVPTGTKVFDWEVPKEWNIRDAYIIDPNGKKMCDFKKNNLHVVGYSIPVKCMMTLTELRPHLFSLPDLPGAIPYLTSYYKETWGFCLSHHELQLLEDGEYSVYIDSSLEKGSITYGEFLLKGETEEEILLSTYVCHPSLANNELSGPLVTAFLYKKLATIPSRRFSYRFVFAPETIGVISFLSKNGMRLKSKLHAGYVLTCVGDNGPFTYKRSKDPSRNVDRVAEHILKYSGKPYSIIDFSIGGSDERQYCSPGFNLPVGSLMRTMYQRYIEYHTSLDNKSFISFEEMESTIEMYYNIICLHEKNIKYINAIPYCEPQLGKRGLYPSVGGQKSRSEELTRMLHLLSWADGNHDLIDIAEKLKMPACAFFEIIEDLLQKELLILENK